MAIRPTMIDRSELARNTGRGFDFASFDLRLSRRFQISNRINLELLAEGFNLLNRANYSVPNNTFGNGTVAVATLAGRLRRLIPRQVQVGFRLGF